MIAWFDIKTDSHEAIAERQLRHAGALLSYKLALSAGIAQNEREGIIFYKIPDFLRDAMPLEDTGFRIIPPPPCVEFSKDPKLNSKRVIFYDIVWDAWFDGFGDILNGCVKAAGDAGWLGRGGCHQRHEQDRPWVHFPVEWTTQAQRASVTRETWECGNAGGDTWRERAYRKPG